MVPSKSALRMWFRYTTQWSNVSRCSLSARAMSRIVWRCPPLQALRATDSLPAAVVGPVERSHGLHVLMSFACRALRSGVQPFDITCLQ